MLSILTVESYGSLNGFITDAKLETRKAEAESEGRSGLFDTILELEKLAPALSKTPIKLEVYISISNMYNMHNNYKTHLDTYDIASLFLSFRPM